MISIAIPAYKGKYLHQAIKSVLDQTYKDFELIVINDASPEDLESIVRRFDDKRIRYCENEINYGSESVVRNWNKCLGLAKGEYFVLFADDDYYEANFLEEMIQLTMKYPTTNIYHCRVRIVDSSGNTISYSQSCPEWEEGIDFIWHRLKGYRYHFAPDFMVKTQFLINQGGFIDFPLAWASDDATWFNVSVYGGIASTNKTLLNWRKSELNISFAGDVRKRLGALESFKDWLYNFIKNNYADNKMKKDIFNEIMNIIPERIYLLKKALLTDNFRLLKWKLFKFTYFFFVNNKNYSLSIKLFISVSTQLLKPTYKNNNIINQ